MEQESPGFRVVADLPIPCPAGELLAETLRGSGVYCRIDHAAITSSADPRSLGNLCTNARGYQTCPSWQREHERARTGGETVEEIAEREQRVVDETAEQHAEIRERADARERAALEDLFRRTAFGKDGK